MKENIVTVMFKRESEAYQALAELKRDQVNYGYKIVQLGIVKKENGVDTPVEGFNSELEKKAKLKAKHMGLMKHAVLKTPDNCVVLVMLVEEQEDIVLNSRLTKYKPVINRYAVSDLEKEIKEAEKLAKLKKKEEKKKIK